MWWFVPVDLIQQLDEVLEKRKQANPEDSYVASLYAKGLGAILAKVSEEYGEVMEAAHNESDSDLIHEVADLWFHTIVLLHHRGLNAEDVIQELCQRFGVSGHDEKAARSPEQQGD